MRKKYNTPHRSRVVKTRLSEKEYADFTERLAPYGISQSEFLRQAIRRATIRPVIHVSAVNDELLAAVGRLAAEYGRIGGNLNQIARYLNEYGAPYNALSGEVRAAISDLAALKYCGDILNFKTYSKSYKNKKRLENDRENWAIFKDVHEPIIERAVFEQVQQKRGKMRKRQAKDGERSMFSGLLVCADCGSNLHFHFNQGNPEIKYFNCSNYKGNRGTCGSTHYVRVDFLEQVVLGEIRRLTKYAGLYEDDFLKEVIGHSRQAEETERRLKEKELKSLLARDDELDGLFERIYEDNVSGKLSDDRFAKMSRRYEEEQKELSEKIKKLRSEIEKQNSRATSTDMFVSIVRKYTRARKLTPRMLNELVEKIEVYNAEKIDGEWVQRLRIHYNCVGEMNIPNEPALPIPAVTVNTRKGVFVSYTTDDRPAV